MDHRSRTDSAAVLLPIVLFPPLGVATVAATTVLYPKMRLANRFSVVGFDEVYGHWTQLPKDERPSLLFHGVSLGALNSELLFHTHDIIADPFQRRAVGRPAGSRS